MANSRLTVADDLVVSLDYTLRLDDGEVVDGSTIDEEPIQFLQGTSQIVPGLEQAIYGMAVGDEKDVVVAPADGYGDRDPEALQLAPHKVFPPDLNLKPGMRLGMRDKSGQSHEVFVTEVRPDGVLLDFNHPLAGQTLHFHVKIAALRPATSEELAHGHSHSAEDGH